MNIPENEKEYFHLYFNETKDEIKKMSWLKIIKFK